MEESKSKQRDRPQWLPDLLLTGGAVAISVGAALIYPPAGWIAGGLLAILGGVLAALGGGGRA